jgi:rRNA-processing protein FCF1
MRLTVKNLGPISEASVDLSKDLIVLTGENNTGKTYLAYVIYWLYAFRNWSSFRFINEDSTIEGIKDLEAINVRAFFETYYNQILDELHDHLSSRDLRSLFASSQTQFSTVKIEVEGLDKEYETKLEGKTWGPLLPNPKGSKPLYSRELSDELLSPIFNKCTLFPAERSGISVFSKELAFNKNLWFDLLLKTNDDIKFKILNTLDHSHNRYAKPIFESLRISQQLDILVKEVSDFAYLADQFEQSLVGGKVSVSPIGDFEFSPNNSESKLEIHLTSSTVKSLAPLVFYLRHQAQKGDFIIIDEPELNLHPNNQIKIARFLARLVNEGFKVMVSTHSDYIMRELNSLIMLGTGKKKSPEKTEDLLKKYKKYEYDKNQLLDNKQVGVYLFSQGKDVEELEIREDGFEIATIDETVDRLNETSQNIFYELFD